MYVYNVGYVMCMDIKWPMSVAKVMVDGVWLGGSVIFVESQYRSYT